LDLDSDSDGLTDVLEAGHYLGDGDIDGRVDCRSGVGANGLCDELETFPDSGIPDYDGNGAPDGAPSDSDADGVPDFRDLDSDGDGYPDAVEAGHILGNTDGTLVCPSGSDDNGLCDDLETSPDSGSTDFDRDGVKDGTPRDTDGDGVPDFRDLDSDDDGLADADERIWGTNPRNPDSDGGGLNDGEEVAAGRNPLHAFDDVELTLMGGGCQATRDQGPVGLALGLAILVRRIARKRAT
jgi:hypothetical protein